MTLKEEHLILYEAYEHYQKTGDKHFNVLPKNPNYLGLAINTVPNMLEQGFVENVSNNLLNVSSISLVPLEDMSFDITLLGIRFVESHWE